MDTLILVRHGQSEHQVRGLYGGWADFDLSDLGRRQATRLAARLAREWGVAPCSLACSDLQRARQTAEAIGGALGVIPLPTPDLRGPSAGIVEGLPQAEARAHFIEPTEPLSDWTPYPGAEPWSQARPRVLSCLERLAESAGDRLIVVTHHVPIHFAVCWWVGLDPEHRPLAWFETDLASVTVLTAQAWGGRTVERLNDTAHLWEEPGLR
jgi:probable phosphoglycerate mutase